MSSFIAEIIGNNYSTDNNDYLSNIRVVDDVTNQSGGNSLKKKIKNNNNNLNVNKLLSMLTSTTSTEDNHNLTGGGPVSDKSIDTQILENKLKELLENNNSSINLTGGNNSATSIDSAILEDKLLKLLEDENKIVSKNDDNQYTNLFTKQNGGNDSTDKNISILEVKKFFKDLKSKGINVDVKLDDKTFSEFFDMAATTTNINNTVSPTSTQNILNNKVIGIGSDKLFSATSLDNMSVINKKQTGGKKYDIISATSTENILNNKVRTTYTDQQFSVTSQNHIDTVLQLGGKGPNPGFEAFLKLKKHVANKLNMPNGPAAGKIAGAVQRDAKSKYPDYDSLKISTEAIRMFDKNMELYKKQADDYTSDTPKKKSKKLSKKIKN